jgi:phage/plasmid primase-like uncharacterized protein
MTARTSNWTRIEKAEVEAICSRVNLVKFMEKYIEDMTDKGSFSVALCPFHSEDTPSFTIYPDHFKCYGCRVRGNVIDAAMRLGKLTFLEAVDKLRRDAGIERRLSNEEKAELERQRREREELAADRAARMLRSAKRIIAECVPSEGTGVIAYLAARGLPLRHQIEDLLFHPKLAQWERGQQNHKKSIVVADWPAMVAIVRNKIGEVVGIHRTYLDRDCTRKAPIDRNKRMLGDCAGGAVRLGPPAESMTTCEGIETGVAVLLDQGGPVWAGLSTSGLAAVELPDAPMGQNITIAADNDANGAGEKAAKKAAARWIVEARRARIIMPPVIETDFADRFAQWGRAA